jgi:hypothetical protein
MFHNLKRIVLLPILIEFTCGTFTLGLNVYVNKLKQRLNRYRL